MHAADDPEADVERLAAAQHGVVSRAQVVELGMTPSQIRTRVDRGSWRRVAPCVFGFTGHADSWRRRCWIALLNAGDGAVLSHSTAGLLHGMRPLQTGPVELIVPRGASRGMAGTRRHRPLDLDPASVQRIDGLAVTDPVRTILDLSAQLRPQRLAELVEHCEVDGICSLVSVGAELARVRRRGRPGVVRFEQVLDRLGPGDGLPRSELECLGDQVRRRAGLPEPHHEHPLPSAHGRPGFVDRAWVEVRLIVEYDGRRWHTRRSEIARDHQRDLEAGALGWQTLRFTWEQLHADADRTAELWRAVYDHRLELLAGQVPDQRRSG